MKKSAYFILFCLLLFCLFYGIRYINRPERAVKAESEIYENKIITSGYIIKTEEVYGAPVSGRIYHYIAEGTKVKKNSILSAVYTGSISEQTLAELNGINKRIAELKNSASDSYSFGANRQENIDTIKNNIIRASITNDLSAIETYRSQINSIVTGSAQDTPTESIESLESKKQALENSIEAGKNDIYSQMAGVFSKNIDGLEGTLTYNLVKDYKIKDYEGISQGEPADDTTVIQGQPVCKVINNNLWYVMLAVKSENAEKIKKGQKLKLRFSETPGIEAEGVVDYISSEDSDTDKNVVIIKFEQYREGVLSLRRVGLEIILESYEGYKLPISAIRIVKNEKGVMVRSDAGTSFRKCKVLYTDVEDQTVIISNDFDDNKGRLKETDSIIVGEK